MKPKTCDTCKWMDAGYFSGTWVCTNENLMDDGEYGEPYDINEEVDCEFWEPRDKTC